MSEAQSGGVVRVALPVPATAAAAGASHVWCLADGLLGFDALSGERLVEAAAPAGAVTLAGSDSVLVVATDSGVVHALDPQTGQERSRQPLGGELALCADAGGAWALDRSSGRLWRVDADGASPSPAPLGAVDAWAPAGDRVVWTSPHDTLLHDGDRSVDLGVGPAERGAVAVCANAAWVSVAGGLLLVRMWSWERGPLVPTQEGPVDHLACAGGILVGGSGGAGLFLLDFAADTGPRSVDVDLGGRLGALVATRGAAWAFPADRAEAVVVPLPV